MFLQELSLAILGGMWSVVVWTWWFIVPLVLFFSWKNFKKASYVNEIEHTVLSIKIPKNNEKGPVAAEMMFAALHGILHSKSEQKKGTTVQEHFSLEIVSTLNSIEFFIWVPKKIKEFVEGQVYAQYPTAEISVVNDYSKTTDVDGDKNPDAIAGTELLLTKDDIYPIKTFLNFDVDPLAGITGMLSMTNEPNEQIWIQILAKPENDDWRKKALSYIASKKTIKPNSGTLPLDFIFNALNVAPVEAKKDAKPEAPKLSHAEETELTAIEDKSAKLGYRVMIRVVYLSKSREKATDKIQAVVGAFKQFNTTNLNGFTGKGLFTSEEFLNAYRARLFNDKGYDLNIEELASLYHLPHVSVETPNIVWTSSKKGEPPSSLPFITDENINDKDISPLAITTFRNSDKLFGIKRDDRRRHMYIIGKTGVGKSRLLEGLAIQDIQRGEGVAFIDPHGEAIDNILKFIPKERLDDVIYLNPSDKEFPLGFNPLESPPGMREETAKGFISVLKRMFGFSWGPRLEYVLNHTVLALAEVEGSTMLGIVRMLTDKNYRKNVVSQVTDPVVQMFWLKEFSTYNDKMATETVAPILNKVGQFTASETIRNIVGQPKSTVNFSEIMDTGKILLVDLSTGKIGEINSELLGSLIITKIQLAAMQRAFIPESERKDFYLYVDEFQNFATESFGTILSEARKYHLSLAVANQYVAQMEEEVRDAVFGNVGTLISFRVGATDASFLEKEFEPIFSQNDLINLDNRHLYLNMPVNGVNSSPFSAKSIPSAEPTEDLTSIVIAISRKKYGTPKKKVEDDIRKWYNIDSVIAGVNANEGDRPITNPNYIPPANKEMVTPQPDKEKPSASGNTNISNNSSNDHNDNNERSKNKFNSNNKEKNTNSRSNSNLNRGKSEVKNDNTQLADKLKQAITENTKNIEPKKLDSPIEKPKLETKTEIKEIIVTVAKPSTIHTNSTHSDKKQREIAPSDFKDITTILPHEKIIISSTKEIKPGEEIRF
ncbi:MAG: type IV secretion system DNA-binding domain-containing protein [bacterium]